MLPKKVSYIVLVSESVIIGIEGCYLGGTLVLPFTATTYNTKGTPRQHPFLSINAELGTHTKKATFLGNTLGVTCCDMINALLCMLLCSNK